MLTHADPDHVGGVADFPEATIHISQEEFGELQQGGDRYSRTQFDHGPRWATHGPSEDRWFGFEARRLALAVGGEVWLVPLFGHTRGHCGVAVKVGGRWMLHVGDAYYLRAELTQPDHPVSALATLRAADDKKRRATLAALRRLLADNADEIDAVGYHDFSEFH